MLQLTEEAAERIEQLRDEHGSDATALRLSRADDSRRPAVRISLVPGPSAGDHVGESQGVRLCIDPAVAGVLDGMVLDRQPDAPTGLLIRPA